MSFFQDLKNTISPNTVDDFVSTINKHSGVARSNKFAVTIIPPTNTLFNLDLENIASQAIRGDLGLNDLVNDPRDISILCESCQMPGRGVQTIEDSPLKNQIKTPTGYIFEDVTFTFLVTQDSYVRKFFDKWVNAIVNPGDHTVAYRNDITTDCIIQLLDEKNLPVFGVKLIGAYPTGINSIDLNTGSEDVVKLSVTMTYKEFKNEGSISSLISGVRENITGSLRRLL